MRATVTGVRLRGTLLIAAALLGSAACGVGETTPEQSWIRLARDLGWTRRLSTGAVQEFESAGGAAFRVVINDDDAWLETPLLRRDWEFQPGVKSGS